MHSGCPLAPYLPTYLDSCTINTQEFDDRWGKKDLTECLHPIVRLILRFETAVPKCLELIELFNLNFELERTTAVSAREWHEQTAFESRPRGRLNFATNEIDRLFTVNR